MTDIVVEMLMEEWRITETKNGEVVSTEPTGRRVWRAKDDPPVEGMIYAPLSNAESAKLSAAEQMRIRN